MSTITSDTYLLQTDRHARVTAGPGAGKTHWLVEHTKNVLRRSQKLHCHARIAVISYTNIAADELKQKLGTDSARVDTGTIHSFLYMNVIKPYLHLIKDDDGQPLVNTASMDGHDEHHVNYQKVDDWLREINLRRRFFLPDQHERLRELLAYIRWRQADNWNDWCLEVTPPEWMRRTIRNAMADALTPEHLQKYKKYYWQEGILDHDDVLYLATRLLHEYPLITACLSARYRFLFIDEFQDTVPAQTNIVHLLAAQGTTVVVIGDAEQSIFTFAGARPEHFYNFTLPDIDEYMIEHNRRSTDRIIALLNHVRADEIVQHGIRAQEGEPVSLIVGTPGQAAQHAKSLLVQDVRLLIVARTRELVRAAQLLGTATPENPWDAISEADSDRKILLHQLLAGLVLARQHRYDTAVRTVIHGIRHRNSMLKSPLKSAAPRSALQRRAIAIALLEAIIKLGSTLDTMSLRAVYEHCCATLTKDFEGLTLSRITRGAFAEACQHCTCASLLNSVDLANTEEVRDARTIHQAKGTECPNVLVCLHGRNDEDTQIRLRHILSPSPTSDEEQRITYVAISRARDRLLLATPDLTLEQEQRAMEFGINVMRLEMR